MRLVARPLVHAAAVLALLLAAALPAGAQPHASQAAASLSSEQQLQAIRQALLEATLDKPTQVFSSAWIDERGALRESHEFHSQAQVRGVRVLSYVSEGQAEPQAKVSAEVLPWNWRQTDFKTGQRPCLSPPKAWRVPMSVSAELGGAFSGEQMLGGQSLLQAAQNSLVDALREGDRWIPSVWRAPVSGTYMRALLGTDSGERQGWTAQIELFSESVHGQMARPQYSEINGPLMWAPAPWQWTLRVRLSPPRSDKTEAMPSFEQALRIEVDAEKAHNHPNAWQLALHTQLQQSLAQWIQKVQAQMRCEPVQFAVRQQAGAGLTLLAGAGSGLRAGDRVLIMNPGWVPSRLLDPRAVDHLALAEVVRSSSHQTELRQLAGPPLAMQGDWVALPL